MSAEALPPDVAELIALHIDSVVRLDVLLMLYRQPAVAITPQVIARQMRIDPAWALVQLEELRDRGLAATLPADPLSYHYAPTTPSLAAAVESLSLLFNGRRVSIITAIYSRPSDPSPALPKSGNLKRPDPKPADTNPADPQTTAATTPTPTPTPTPADPPDPLQNFTDAFTLRKPRPDDGGENG